MCYDPPETWAWGLQENTTGRFRFKMGHQDAEGRLGGLGDSTKCEVCGRGPPGNLLRELEAP